MAPIKRKPPDRPRRLSWNFVAADGFDNSRDKPGGPKKQQAFPSQGFDAETHPIIARAVADRPRGGVA